MIEFATNTNIFIYLLLTGITSLTLLSNSIFMFGDIIEYIYCTTLT